MTLIIAAKSRNGITAIADRAAYCREGEGYRLERLEDKIKPLWNGRGFVSVSGVVRTMEGIVNSIESNSHDDSGLLSFLKHERTEVDQYFKECEQRNPPKRLFIFGVRNGSFEIKVNDEASNVVPKSTDFYGLGRGYYPEVEEFMRQSYSSSLSSKLITELLVEAMRLSDGLVSERETIQLIGIQVAQLDETGFRTLV